MSIWDAIRQRLGGDVTADSDTFVEDFFQNQIEEDPEWQLLEHERSTHSFIEREMEQDGCRGIALVTSGPTNVPLDRTKELFVDLTGRVQEYQGPACVEYLLSIKYSVIFLCREDSLQPFTRHFQKYIQKDTLLDIFQYQDENDCIILGGMDKAQTERFYKIMKTHAISKQHMLKVSFSCLQQYLLLLRIATQAIHKANTRGVVILAATVMEYYVPIHSETPFWGKQNGANINAIRNSQKNANSTNYFSKQYEKIAMKLSIHFVRAPNLIRKIRKDWCPKAFLVSFRYDLPQETMIETAHKDLEKYGVDVIAGVNRMEHPHQILLVTEQDETILTCPEHEDINDAFAARIADLHRNFCKMRAILQKAKELLLLSAKFCMLKPTDLLNEDAAGNKNVKFGKGLQIRTQRKLGAQSPIYELKEIFQNRSHCARAHVWEGNLAKSNTHDSGLDVVIAFSPAGTPNTIRDVWGDFWSGWAEKEICELKYQLKSVSLTSALDVVTASITGDYSSAAALLQFMWSKIGSAWSEGEQTRVRQSIQNMISAGLIRGLVDVTDLTSLEELIKHPLIREYDTLVLDHPRIQVHTRSVRRHDNMQQEGLESQKQASHVRVHRSLKGYMDDMIMEGIIEAIMKYIKIGAAVHITGYSMGGMLGQLLMLYLGDRCRVQGLDVSKIDFVGFGSPRVGDAGFAARLKLLFEPEQILNVMHPSDNIHAFPPTSEGYSDAAIKIFLRENGLGVARRLPSSFSMLPIVRGADRIIDRVIKKSHFQAATVCCICERKGHSIEQHRCRYCTERGTHRGSDCPHRGKPCRHCGRTNHSTGEHKCKVCQQYGHRGRECHTQRDVGMTELVTYFRYHDFLYYDTNMKESVEFSAA